MNKILVIDDELNILQLYKLRLTDYGFEVFTATDGTEAFKQVYQTVFDLIVVDAMMPEMDGFSFLKRLRNEGFTTPVIMITALNQLEDKKQGFLSGADDYMTKPIEFDELYLRINALFKRAKIATEKKITVGNTILDLGTLTVTNQPLSLSITFPKKEFSILYKLLSFPEKTFTKTQLLDEFWGLDSFSGEDVVKVYVSKIRSAIEPFPEIDILTVRGIGYRGIKNEK